MRFAVLATWEMALEGCRKSLDALHRNEALDESIMEGINAVEDDPDVHTVGYGGYPDEKGHVTLDGAYMDGDSLHFGAVGCVEGFRSPVRIAHSLMERNADNFLTGAGAEEYARLHGFETRNNLSNEAEAYWKNHQMKDVHDTVCFAGLKDGHMAVGVSTSGLAMKMPGRIGDSPLPGCGYYADSVYGAAAATGMGEEIMKGCLSFAAVQYLKMGMSAQQAADQAVDELDAQLKRRSGHAQPMSLIVLAKDGTFGAGTNTPFTFCYGNNEKKVLLYEAEPSAHGAQIHLRD